MFIILHCAFVMISLATNIDDEPGRETTAFDDETTTTTSSLKKVNKTNQVQDEIGMLPPPLDFSAALNTTTVVSSTASVSIVTELTMTTTPHQTDDHRGTIKEVLS